MMPTVFAHKSSLLLILRLPASLSTMLHVDSQESLTGEDRPELSGTTKEVTERNNTDHILDKLINWQYLLPPIKLFYILP
jgi:hypothetical protein